MKENAKQGKRDKEAERGEVLRFEIRFSMKTQLRRLTFEQRLEGGDEQIRIYLEEKHPGQKHQQHEGPKQKCIHVLKRKQGGRFSPSKRQRLDGAPSHVKPYESQVKVARSCPPLCDRMDYTVHGILQQEYWSGQPFPSPGDLPSPGIQPRSPALQMDSLI